MGRCLKSPQVSRASCLCLSPFTGNVPRGVFVKRFHRKTENVGAKSCKAGFLCIAKRVAMNVMNSNLNSYVADSNE